MKTKIFTFFVALTAFLFLQVHGQSGTLSATNYAISLPGVSGAASNIKISGLNLISLPYTMEMWFKPDGTQINYAGLIYTRGTSPNNTGLQYAASWQSTGAVRMMTNITGDYGTVTGTVSAGVWHHIAVVVTESASTIYLDGVATTRESLVNPVYDFTTGDLYIGWDFAVDNRAFKGLVDEVRIWNVARSASELNSKRYAILNGTESGLIGYWNFNDSSAVQATDLTSNALNGTITGGTYVRSYPIDLLSACGSLDLGDISAVTADIALSTTVGTNVTINWISSNTSVIANDGKVIQPDKYDATVKLTATLAQVDNGVTYTLTKEFTATVKAKNISSEIIAQWDFTPSLIFDDNGTFKVTDNSGSGFVGSLMNDAGIRTIGTTEKFNVLDLGNGTGYFDMGTEIGKAIYSLRDYTMCGFFRVDSTYTSLNSNGNFYWTFSNTVDAMTDRNGYIIGSLKNQNQSVSTNYYATGNQAVGVNTNAPIGSWHHIAYTQNGTTGTIFVDGVSVATGPNTNLPSTAITIAGQTGTLYNWLGRSNYTSDVYLRKTLLYDFQLLSVSLSASDWNSGGYLDVKNVISRLNTAYSANPQYIYPELTTEMNNLSLGDLSAVTSNINLPVKGVDTSVSISWKSTNDKVIDATGIVTRPNYYNYPDTLTATLSKNGQKVTKKFPATVLIKEGTEFTNNLLVKYDFTSVSDSVVTDVAEKHLTGTLKNKASIRTIGSTVKYNVLNLGDSIGYFDLGPEVGKLMYNLSDYTMSAYYRVDTAYHALSSDGNFLWTLSNTKDAINNATGYIFGSLKDQSVIITRGNYTVASGNQTVSFATPALQGGWHNLTYTQSGSTGTIYIDGYPFATDTITNLPSTALPRQGQLGTLYNWLGRSCYTADVYLRKTLVYDYRLYKVALSGEQIQTSILNIGNTISALDAAYNETPNAVKTVLNSDYKVISTVGGIKILGLTGTEKISLYDITGRQLRVYNPSMIVANSGVYVVRINNYVTKVLVK